MNIHDFEIFKVIADCKSFSRASAQLFIAQPSLSKTIQKLERKLGVQLFERSNRIIRLTDEGQLFYEKTNIILQEYEALRFTLADQSTAISGSLTIGVPQIIGTILFAPIASAFCKSYPQVSIRIVEDAGLKIEKAVEQGQVDVGFVIVPTFNNALEEHLLFEAPFVMCLPLQHPLTYAPSIALADLKEDSWIVFDESFALHNIMMESCKKEGFIPKAAFRTTQWDLMATLVEQQLGVAMLPQPLVERFSLPICTKTIHSQHLSWKIGLIVKKERYKSRVLHTFLKSVFVQNKSTSVPF